MKNIKTKLATLWQNTTNAGKIRTGMTVQRRLELATLSAICALVVTFLTIVYGCVVPGEYWNFAIIGACSFWIASWSYGLRHAIAESQDARKAYMAESRRRVARAIRRLGRFCFWAAIVALALAVQLAILSVCIKLDMLPSELLELLPPLEGMADKIVVHLNDSLEWLSSFIR